MKTWKIQKFASDVVYDLRTRGLLPIVVVLLLAIVAAPILIKGMGGTDSGSGPVLSAEGVKPAPEGEAAVVAYEPGLRNYRDRLDGRTSKNPFKQQYPGGDDDQIDGAGSGGEAGDEGINEAGSGGGNGGITLTTTRRSKLFYFYYETDVRTGETGQDLKRSNDIDVFTQLPSSGTPVAVYLGVAAGGKQAVFSVSRSVTAVSGQGTCYPNPESCELLAVPNGKGADLLHSGDDRSYRIEVARIKLIKSTKPPG
jgi:hypothetical protein